MLKGISIVVVCLLVISSLAIIIDINDKNEKFGVISDDKCFITKSYNHLAYESHSAISIYDDLDFVEQGWSGFGTAEHPYVIENLEIAYDDECILLSHTTAYFVIRNCYLHSSSTSSVGEAIHLNHADHGTVENCTIKSKGYGVYAFSSTDIRISNNSMNDIGNLGIRLTSSTSCWIDGNQIHDITNNGILIGESSYITIERNTIWNCSLEALYMRQADFCDISNNSFSDSPSGAYLESCDTALVVDNSFFSNDEIGFANYDSDDCTFTNNSISNNDGYGVHWNRGDNSYIYGNTISNNGLQGFYLYYTLNCTFIENVLVNDGLVITGAELVNWVHQITNNVVQGKNLGYFVNSSNSILDGNLYGQIILVNCANFSIQGGSFGDTDTGIAFYFCEDCTVNSASIADEMIGVSLYSSESCNITDSILTRCGISVLGSTLATWIHSFIGTTVNGKQVGYYFNQSDLSIDGGLFGQVIIVNSTSLTVMNGNFENATLGVGIAFSVNCSIVSNSFIDDYYGIRVQECIDCSFENNTIHGSLSTGLLVYSSEGCTITNNSIMTSSYGVYISSSTDCGINESTISHNSYGVYLRSSTLLNVSKNTLDYNYNAFYIYDIDDCTFDDNFILNSTRYGMIFYYSSMIIIRNCTNSFNGNHGVFFYYSSDSIILDSNFCRNIGDGISLYGTDYCHIVNNTANENSNYGILIHVGSDYNTIFGNIITDNQVGNGYGYTSTNTWDNSVATGNYWSDYRGPGTYSIDGPGNNIDRYPQGPEVIITSHIDVSYQWGSLSASFTWDCYSSYPDYYIIYVDGGIHGQGYWDGASISVDVLTNSLGIHNYTLYVNGTSGFYRTDTVMTTIYDSVPVVDSPNDIEYNFDTTGHNIVWHASDYNPDAYEIYRNGFLLTSKIWNGLAITVSIDGLAIGSYDYMIRVNDTNGNSADDIVHVTVYDTAPYLEAPYGNIMYEEGSMGHNIYWNASDANPDNYAIYADGIVRVSIDWDGLPITYSVDGLSVGHYNYTIVLFDTSGLFTSNTVIVDVTPESIVTTTTTTTTTSTTTQTNTTTTGIQIDPSIIILIGVTGTVIVIIAVIIGVKRRS